MNRYRHATLVLSLVALLTFTPPVHGASASNGAFTNFWCNITSFFGFTCDTPNEIVITEPEVSVAPPSPLPQSADYQMVNAVNETPAPNTTIIEEHNTYTTNPATVVYQTLDNNEISDGEFLDLFHKLANLISKTGQQGSVVSRDLFDKQIDKIYEKSGDNTSNVQDNITNLETSIAEAVSTNLLTVTGDTTIDGNTTVGGDLSVVGTITAGILNVDALSSGGALVAPYFTATSTTDLNTFMGNVGIGTTAPTNKVDIVGSSAAQGTAAYALNVSGLTNFSRTETVTNNSRPVSMSLNFSASPSSAIGASTDWHGFDLSGSSISNNMTANSSLYPFESTALWGGSGTLGSMIGGYFQTNNNSSGTVNNATNLLVYHQNVGNGTVGQVRGVYIRNPNNTGSGVITNNYGIYIDNQTAGATLNYGIYNLATRNLFGALQIGSGATSPESVFEVNGTAATSTIKDTATGINSNEYPLGSLAFSGSDSSLNVAGVYASIDSYALDTNANMQGSAGEGGSLRFNVWRHLSGGAPRSKITAMTLNEVGNAGIGTTSPSAKLTVTQSADSATGGVWLSTSNNTDFRSQYMNTSGVLSFYGGDTAGTLNTATLNAAGEWTNASDISYKENIEKLSYGLDVVLALQPRSYDIKNTNNHRIGFIAQEVEEVIPEVVSGEDGSKGISYGNLVAVAISAIQELATKVNGLTESLTSKFITAEKVKTDTLCVGQTCITEDELIKFLEQSDQSSAPAQLSASVVEENVKENEEVAPETVPENPTEPTEEIPAEITPEPAEETAVFEEAI